MSAKILHSLKDESRDLHKQIGCMSGIFQLFDRHHFLAGRRINGQNHKRLPPGENCDHAVEPRAVQKATEKNRKKAVKEKQRNSTESSKTTVASSTCSSSFSSLEHQKAAEQEPSLSSRTISNDKHARDLSLNQPNVLMHIRRQSVDLQDLVKDSTYREARGISVKPAAKDGAGHALTYIDSPRPSPIKSTNPRVSGVNESFQVPGKLRVAPFSSNEEKDGGTHFVPKDARRFSYDGRESRDASKSTVKLREIPRLSLDSKESSTRRGCNPETKANYFIKDLQREYGNSNKMLDLQHEPGSAKRPSNVVAKLMGLDLSDSVSTTDSPLRLINTGTSDRSDPFSRSSRATTENKQDIFSGILLVNTKKDFSSPQRRSTDSVMKPTSNSKFPIETAPWRQPHRSKGSQRSAFKHQEEPTKAPNSSSSVYGEMEKRLADLEFKKSGKDLRALKQILEAMQKTKAMTDTRKDHALNFASQISNESISSDSTVKASQRNLQSKISVPATAKGSLSPKSYKSPIVIMKPAKLIDKTHSSASMVDSMNDTLGLRKLRTSDPAKDPTPRNNHVRDPFNRHLHSIDDNSNARTLKSAQKPKASQTMSEEKVISSSRSSKITSPKMQQRRLGLEKQSPPSTPSLNSSMTRRQHTRQSLEATTPGRKLGHKTPSLHQSNAQLRETSTKMREMSHHDDSTSQQSGSTISLTSHTDTAASVHQSDRITGTHFQQHNQKIKHPAVGLIDDRSTAETRKASSEQPSPVSVLDSTFYRDDSPSPVKKISNAFKDDEAQILDIAGYDPMNQALLFNNTMPSPGAEIDHKRLENLIQNHRCMSRTHKDPITGPLCDSTNPDHMYISEILLASGILEYLESPWTTSELHTSDHLINPNLFLALEDIRTNTMPSDLQPKPDEKLQRKLVFEVVNEFLVQKLVVEDSLKQWFPPHKLADGKPRSQQLLKELCSEVDQLQRKNLNGSLDDEDESLRNILLEDFMDQAKNWTECDSEIPGVVLDVERLIFKDLINEIVSGDSVGLHGWFGGHCRQLFSEKGAVLTLISKTRTGSLDDEEGSL
ncbi:protein LONGIFOLIA 1-like [Pyrus ussuriensis x Pyrus communis]|uniref:Protein LONGIFOLIA 1-like n=1 Tax=Pyrus ussuriensis x Pyrus communis TaxID=2448454 RepID=A0A5N5GAD4_9ROSA|nr:protein LONGIFOLIA 1-like [Pyrus ussuriensis x Pyrus communis]